MKERERRFLAEGRKLRAKISTKGYRITSADEAALDRLERESEDLKHEREQYDAFAKMTGYESFGDLSTDNVGMNENTTKSVGAPKFGFTEPDMKALYAAIQHRAPSFSITAQDSKIEKKAAFATGDFASGGLPPELRPDLTAELPYEPDDVFSHFVQLNSPQANSVEYLQHTGNTNPAAAVAELGTKPDLGPQWTTVTTSFTKIAGICSYSEESLSDFSYFSTLIPREMFAALQDARSDEILNGSGSAPHMLGLFGQAGTLTRAVGSDTPLDAIRKSFSDLRTGSAYATADTIVLNPDTWAELQLIKSDNGLYVINPADPMAIGGLDNIFGVNVVQNTKVPAGKAIVFDSTMAIVAWRRSGPRLDVNGYSDTDWQTNALSFRIEERIAYGLRFPKAVSIVTGLPTGA